MYLGLFLLIWLGGVLVGWLLINALIGRNAKGEERSWNEQTNTED